jgi:hypothetical protein
LDIDHARGDIALRADSLLSSVLHNCFRETSRIEKRCALKRRVFLWVSSGGVVVLVRLTFIAATLNIHFS